MARFGFGMGFGSQSSAFAPLFGSSAFVTTWNTENLGGTGSLTKVILLPWTNPGQDVDWGDGTINQLNTHTYSVGGIKTVTISDSVTGFRFAAGGDKLKITSVVSAGSLVIDNNSMFSTCTNITSLNLSVVDSVTTTDLGTSFYQLTNCDTLNITGLVGSSITNMVNMFRFCKATIDIIGIEDLDVSALTNAALMLQSVTLPTAKYSEMLINYEAQSVQNTVTFDGGSSLYSAGAAATARAALIADHTWTITDGGAA